jgi:hypothetical protein
MPLPLAKPHSKAPAMACRRIPRRMITTLALATLLALTA